MVTAWCLFGLDWMLWPRLGDTSARGQAPLAGCTQAHKWRGAQGSPPGSLACSLGPHTDPSGPRLWLVQISCRCCHHSWDQRDCHSQGLRLASWHLRQHQHLGACAQVPATRRIAWWAPLAVTMLTRQGCWTGAGQWDAAHLGDLKPAGNQASQKFRPRPGRVKPL